MQQSLLRQLIGITAVSLACGTCTAFASHQSPPPTFSLGEHAVLGDEIRLAFAKNDPGQTKIAMQMPNGEQLTYGQIVTLGDFYAVDKKPISKAISEPERKARFIAAFNSFARSTAAPVELEKIKNVISQEDTILAERMKNGEQPEAIYKSISNEMARQLNCATGGGCDPDTWWLTPGRYLTVAKDNYDHFSNNAIIAYTAGHQAAIEQALIARQTGNRNDLELAYAMNAFACHFLSDRFSAGHIRTPRNELANNVIPDLVGSLLAGYMHNEESKAGIHVHNIRDQHWISYGDWSYFSAKNEYPRVIIRDAMQASANDILSAYLYGNANTADDSLSYVPYADEVNENSNFDISPMFYWDANTNKLMRRSSLENKFDRHWTNDWWGWSTLSELKALEG